MKKITVSSNGLAQALRQTRPALALASNPFYEIFSSYLFETSDSKLVVTATNCAWHITRTIEATIEATEPVKFSVEGTYLRRILNLLKNEDITIICHESQIEVTYSNGVFYLPIEEYPETNVKIVDVETLNYVKFETPLLRKYLKCAVSSVTDDFLRPALSGVCFEYKDNLVSIAASDGHILSYTELNSGFSGDFSDSHFIMPRVVVNALLNILPKAGWCTMGWKDLDLYITIDDDMGERIIFIGCKTIDGRYPNWRAVIPSHFQATFELNRGEFVMAVKRAAVFAPESKLIRCTIPYNEKALTVSSKDSDFEHEYKEKIPVSYVDRPAAGNGYEICFSWKSLQNIIKHLTGQKVIINANNETAGCTIAQEGENRTKFVIMSMYGGK